MIHSEIRIRNIVVSALRQKVQSAKKGMVIIMAEHIWHDRKRTFLGLPWSFTRYSLTKEKLMIETGFFSRFEDEIRLYRITDVSLRSSFGERLLGLGTIHCCSGDKTSPEFDIKRIKKSRDVKELLSDLVEDERMKHRVAVRENFSDDDHDDDFDDDRDDNDDDEVND